MSSQENTPTNNDLKALGGVITLYQDEDRDTKNYYYRFRNPLRRTGYIRKSSKTTDLAHAKRIAIDHYEELKVKQRMGLTEGKTTIKSLVERYIKELPRTSKAPAKALLKKYWLPFFGDRDLATMDDQELFEFAEWRTNPKNYFHARTKNKRLQRSKDSNMKGIHAVAKATLQSELKYLRFFLRRGFKSGRIAKLPTMRINYDNFDYVSDIQSNKRRGRFTRLQLKEIENWKRGFAIAWGNTLALEEEGKVATNELFQGHTVNRFHRTSFYMLITLVSQTALRPQECRLIRWRDIKTKTEDGETFTYIEVRREVAKKPRHGKGKARIAICSNMEVMFKRFQMYEKEWERMFGRPPSWDDDPDNSDLIFANPRNPKKSRLPAIIVKNGLERISKERGVVVHGNYIKNKLFPDGQEWKQNTLYSFRSAYMTNQLNHGTSLHHLSLQVGSAPETILKHYAIDESLDYWKYYTSHVRNLRAKSK
mgnify:FL=1